MSPLRARMIRGVVLVAGLLATQFILFGPSLIGQKILLPLDILARPWMYLSPSESARWGPPRDPIISDPVLELELDRQFAVSEVRAGRLPLWNPHEYCGQPFLAANDTAVFSPFRVLDYLWPGPTVIAWDQVLKTLIAGIGAYFFFRIVLSVGFAPAVIGAWLWPLCGYYIQWAGHPQSAAAAWLPWIFLFTDCALRNPSIVWVAGLAVATVASLLSGHAASSAQVLLADGVFFVWRVVDLHRLKGIRSRPALLGVAAVLTGWLLGALLSAPQSLPTLDYLRTSHRLAARIAEGSETPPAGLGAIPQLVLPEFNGTTRRGEVYFGGSGNLPESASTGYVGLITALVLTPLAFCSRKNRSFVFFALILGILGMGQLLGLPLLKQLYESFPLNTLRENRLAIATGWATAIAGVIGLDAINQGLRPRRGWLMLAAAVPLSLGIWCLVRAFSFPAGLEQLLAIVPVNRIPQISYCFKAASLYGFAVCMVALILWLAIGRGLNRYRWFAWALGLLAVAEVVAADYNVYPQSDPALYYPRQPILTALAQAPAGRVCGVHCFPACLTESHGLQDVRGYDGVDPQRLVELLYLTQSKMFDNPEDQSGVLQGYFPARFPSPITDMMNLRYLIFTGDSPKGRHPRYVFEGYWVYENLHCLPRVFIPRRVQVVNDSAARLQLLAQPNFNPTDIAFIESPGRAIDSPAEGEAKIAHESPSHLTIEYNLQTPALIVLSDLWDAGWRAKVNGVETSVLHVNHAFRGVEVSAGKGILQYDYEPAHFFLGLELAIAAGTVLIGGLAVSLIVSRKSTPA